VAELRFLPLPGTAEEARAIGKVLPSAKVLLGPDATEAAIKAAAHPRIVHLATHGFFLPVEQVNPKGACR
jgi:CHAT domain-containing protein